MPQRVSVTPTMPLDDLRTELLAADRNAGPAILTTWIGRGALSAADVAEVLPDVWSAAEWPERALGTPRWVQLFRFAGFVSDDASASRPESTLRIYRGCTPRRRRGMAWTTDAERAEWFAQRSRDYFRCQNATVFVADVPPAGVLARIIGGRQEAEVVVDPKMLGRTRALRQESTR